MGLCQLLPLALPNRAAGPPKLLTNEKQFVSQDCEDSIQAKVPGTAAAGALQMLIEKEAVGCGDLFRFSPSLENNSTSLKS